MEGEQIIEFVKEHFTNHRQKLIPKLQSFVWEDAVVANIYRDKIQQIERPINAYGNFSESVKENLLGFPIDIGNLGDISDNYTIVLNPAITKVDDWDFVDLRNSGEEVHCCKVWINWFLPVYYLSTSYDKLTNRGEEWQYGFLGQLTDFESSVIDYLTTILSNYGYQSLDWEFLKTRMLGLNTDCAEDDNASFFDCLFSDLVYPISEEKICRPNPW